MSDEVVRPRLRITWVLEYDADPENYDTSDVDLMASIDQANVDDGSFGVDLLQCAIEWPNETTKLTVRVEPI